MQKLQNQLSTQAQELKKKDLKLYTLETKSLRLNEALAKSDRNKIKLEGESWRFLNRRFGMAITTRHPFKANDVKRFAYSLLFHTRGAIGPLLSVKIFMKTRPDCEAIQNNTQLMDFLDQIYVPKLLFRAHGQWRS